MGHYGFGRGGWLQVIPVLVSGLLVIGFIRTAVEIADCTGVFSARHVMLAVIAAVPAVLPLFLANRWLNAGLGLAWLFAFFIYLAINAPLAELMALLPAAACVPPV
ncbi:hypothetical protein sos41_00720 [Alphaproteobacteria bacterium SO-S41]|nr:hypothetical protein sos41_00720 [Alphaproteobacteria bacterium SO-S41]